MKYALGVLGLSVEELAGLTPFLFEMKCDGHKMQSDYTENMFRKVAYFAMAPHLDSKKNVTPQSVWPMDIDAENGKKLLFTKREIKKKLDKYTEFKQRMLQRVNTLTN